MTTLATTLTQYVDPITRRRVTVALCEMHDKELLWRLRSVGIGSGSTETNSLLQCTECGDGPDSISDLTSVQVSTRRPEKYTLIDGETGEHWIIQNGRWTHKEQ